MLICKNPKILLDGFYAPPENLSDGFYRIEDGAMCASLDKSAYVVPLCSRCGVTVVVVVAAVVMFVVVVVFPSRLNLATLVSEAENL